MAYTTVNGKLVKASKNTDMWHFARVPTEQEVAQAVMQRYNVKENELNDWLAALGAKRFAQVMIEVGRDLGAIVPVGALQ